MHRAIVKPVLKSHIPNFPISTKRGATKWTGKQTRSKRRSTSTSNSHRTLTYICCLAGWNVAVTMFSPPSAALPQVTKLATSLPPLSPTNAVIFTACGESNETWSEMQMQSASSRSSKIRPSHKNGSHTHLFDSDGHAGVFVQLEGVVEQHVPCLRVPRSSRMPNHGGDEFGVVRVVGAPQCLRLQEHNCRVEKAQTSPESMYTCTHRATAPRCQNRFNGRRTTYHRETIVGAVHVGICFACVIRFEVGCVARTGFQREKAGVGGTSDPMVNAHGVVSRFPERPSLLAACRDKTNCEYHKNSRHKHAVAAQDAPRQDSWRFP